MPDLAFFFILNKLLIVLKKTILLFYHPKMKKSSKPTTKKTTSKTSNNKKEIKTLLANAVEYWFVFSTLFRIFVIALLLFSPELSIWIHMKYFSVYDILSMFVFLYLVSAIIHFVFSVIFLTKTKQEDYVVPSLTANIIMFLILIML